jgi:epoxyqueuosine reductase
MASTPDPAALTSRLKARAGELGFDRVGIVPAGPSPDHERYRRWLEAGYAGEMGYLWRHLEAKADPRRLLPEARSLILVGLNYAAAVSPARRRDPSRGQIAAYALGDDYHAILRAALYELDGWLRTQTGRSSQGRAFVDSAPVLERAWAHQAGLGFIGKNTCLIAPGLGSWLFLGGLLVPEVLAYDPSPLALSGDHDNGITTPGEPAGGRWRFADGRIGTCGRCRRCLDVCPTQAFVAPYVLDARRCIAYLTIELRGVIPVALRPAMGNWVFGCDLCQEVCPWNRSAPPTRHPRLQPSPDRISPPLLDLLALDREGFNRRFRGSPVMRSRWEGFLRNVCVAAGNWGDPATATALAHHLHTAPPVVAVHAAWALGRLAGQAGRLALRAAWERRPEPEVRAAIAAALAG